MEATRKNHTPEWLKLWKKAAQKLVRKSGTEKKPYPGYKANQRRLKQLIATGLGNCVAWSNLMATICAKCNVEVYHIVVGSAQENHTVRCLHQISLIIDERGRVFLQSNAYLYRIGRMPARGLDAIMRRILTILEANGDHMGWKSGSKIEAFWKPVFKHDVDLEGI